MFRKFSSSLLKLAQTRCSSSASGMKKFYKVASVVQVPDGQFEVDLDSRKLKSPHGSILKFENEALAHAVAHEWNSQPEDLKMHRLPLTNQCFQATDRHVVPKKLAEALVNFVKTDTVLFFMDDVPELFEQQKEKWGPVIEWVNKRFNVEVSHTTGFTMPKISDNTVPVLTNHILSFNKASLLSIEKMSATLKSLMLTLAVIDRHLTCEEAVKLALLEQRFQASKWGHVEEFHDVELQEMLMRCSACYVHIQMTNEVSTVKKQEH